MFSAVRSGANVRGNLTFKLSWRVALVVVGLLLALGTYFDVFLRNSFLEATNDRMRHAAQRLVFDLSETEADLRKITRLATSDERLVASIELINKYQDKQNYNRFLIDEEKKTLAQGLLDRLKVTSNSHLTLFGADGSLIAYARACSGSHCLGFQSMVDGRETVFERLERDSQYHDIGGLSDIPATHINHYPLEALQKGSVITYHRDGDSLVVRAHQNMLLGPQPQVIGQMEFSRTLGKGYFDQVSQQLGVAMHLDFAEQPEQGAARLEMPREVNQISAREVDDEYLARVEKSIVEGVAYVSIALNRASHSAIVNQNRLRFLGLIGVLSVVMLVWMRWVVRRNLAQPLAVLMAQIGRVGGGDYTTPQLVSTGDELEAISASVNRLAIAVQQREDSLKQAQHEQAFLSNHDSLTGLPNRRFFAARLDHALSVARRTKGLLAVMFLDLDQFKLVNDTLGHDVGDVLLTEVSARLSAHVRHSDTLARIGGDEFNVLMEGVSDLREVEAAACQLIELFREPFECDGRFVSSTVSVGVAMYPSDGTDSVTLHKNADLAMYRAKSNGRNAYSFFSEELSREAQARAETITALNVALDQGDQFHMVYQPKCSASTGELVSAEALIRWHRPGVGNVPPLQFVPLAEDTGQILRIGDWIVQQVCRDIVALNARGVVLEHVSLNVSNVQLRGHDFLRVLLESVERTGLSSRQLELEITESYVSEDTSEAISALHRFRQAGFKLAIDDFGTGYSSMSYLQRLPFTRLKIDKSFVDGLPHDPDSVCISHAIIGLAKNFGLALTAEGVEHADQLEFLRNEGCDEIQGFHFSRPLALDDFVAFAQRRH